MSYKRKKIHISKIIINPENYRFDPVDNELQAINIMLKENNEKVKSLLKDILNNGINPSDLPIVIDTNGKYLVLEGNRRFTALKIYNDVNILKKVSESYFEEYSNFLKKNKAKNTFDLENIECLIFNDISDANHWIEVKHTNRNNGIGTVRWNPQQSDRFRDAVNSSSDKVTYIPSLIEYLTKSDYYPSIVKENINKIPTTTLERLLGDPLVRDFIGIDIIKKVIYKMYPDTEIAKPLSKILVDLINKEITVSNVYTKSDRIDYISKFKEDEKIDIDKKLPEKLNLNIMTSNPSSNNSNNIENKYPKQTTLFPTAINNNENNSLNNNTNDGGSQIELSIPNNNFENTTVIDNLPNNKKIKQPIKTGNKKNINNRKYLIPGHISISIKNQRINQVYIELRKLEIDKFPNAISVLFRVFLELSLDEYIDTNKLDSVNSNDKLNKKVQECLNHLKLKGLISKDLAKPVNVCVSDTNSIFSINTFNSYVHNKHMYPDPTQLKNAWNQLEGFIISLLGNC